MQEFLEVGKTFQFKQGEVVNDTWKLTELKKYDPTYSGEQRIEDLR